MRARWIVLLGLAGCGRIGFDPNGQSASDANGHSKDVYNVAFVTSTTQIPGAVGGVAGADSACMARAAAAGLSGRFVAWASTSTLFAPKRLAGARGWVRTDGMAVADQTDDLAAGALLHPVRTDEYGRDVGKDQIHVATGTYGGVVNDNCDDFASTSAQVMVAYAFNGASAWTNTNTVACTQPARFYCFQVDRNVALTYAKAVGRIAFVSVADFTPSSGIAVADAICANEAASAGLPGSYRALLGRSAASAASRFDTTGPTWVRPDGIALAASAQAFLQGDTETTMTITATGELRDVNEAITGIGASAFDTSDPTLTCDDWTNPSGTDNLGYPYSTLSGVFSSTFASCDQRRPVYCLEQ